jgi:ABC-type polysaccharide/polyol phosphate transport system ATPase subunit
LKELVLGQRPRAEEVLALDDVSFTVHKGEAVGVIGSNGSGKSTLLKLVAGTSRPTSGSLDVYGRVAALLEIGAGFHPDFTGRENAFLNGAILGLSRRQMEAAMPSIEAFADIGRFFDAPVKAYSSGMYARLGFAVAVHVDPDILLVDEVLAVGDEEFQHKCYAKINDFRARSRTILFVSHDLAAVRRLCRRAIALDRGKVLAEGDVEYVIAAYEETVRSKEEHKLAAALTPQRWGDRRVELTSVKLLGGDGSEARVFDSGDALTIELAYRSSLDGSAVAFGVAVYRDDGVLCYGTNTALERIPLTVRRGDGVVRFQASRLDLLEGQYVLDIAVHSPDEREMYDYHAKAYPFRVRGGNGEVGLARIEHRWQAE